MKLKDIRNRYINLKRKLFGPIGWQRNQERIRFTFEDGDGRVSLRESPDGIIRVDIDDFVGEYNIIFQASQQCLYNLGFALDWTKIYDTRRDK